LCCRAISASSFSLFVQLLLRSNSIADRND
jgi:hypothetical protein